MNKNLVGNNRDLHVIGSREHRRRLERKLKKKQLKKSNKILIKE